MVARKRRSMAPPSTSPRSARELPSRLPVTKRPYEHQLKAFRISMLHDASALLMEQGTGKTLVAIANASQRYLDGEIKNLLVVCPLSVMYEWERQFEDSEAQTVVTVLTGSVATKLRLLGTSMFADNRAKTNYLDVVVINYDSVWRLEEYFRKHPPDMIICDESQRIKNPSTKVSRCLARMGKKTKYRMILTGTPVTQSPLDFFSQYKFLDRTIFGTAFTPFRNKYAIMGGYGGYQVMGYRDLEDLARKAHSIAYRVRKVDALDLPECIDEYVYADLESSARRAYEEMRKDALTSIDSGTVTAAIVLTKMLRMSQITGGFVRTDENNSVPVQISKAKLAALQDTLEDTLSVTDKKVVIFARFIPEIHAIVNMLQQQQIPTAMLIGSTPAKHRGQLIKSFQEEEDPRVLVVQVQTGGLGITLTRADTMIFYSLDYSYANYEQAKARVHRIGQERKVTYIHILAHDTIDEQVLKRLHRKQDLASLVVDELRKVVLGVGVVGD